VLTELRGRTRESAEPPGGNVERQEYPHPTYIPTQDPSGYLDLDNSREYLQPPAGQVEGQEYSHPTYIPTLDYSGYQDLDNSRKYLAVW